MHKIYNEVGLTTWMFSPKYSSNLHCNAMDKCVISEKTKHEQTNDICKLCSHYLKSSLKDKIHI